MEEPNRRAFVDRRSRPTPALSRYSLVGRRHSVRRETDPQNVYMDRVGWKLGGVLLSILMFHVLDAFFTLAHIARGGNEVNPIMDYFLQIGPAPFVAVKLGLASLGLLFLGLHARWPLVRQGIAGLFVLYAGVVGYHFFLIWRAGAAFWRLDG